jgi:hypothetical protein
LGREIAGHHAAHLGGDRQLLLGAVQAVDPDDVSTGVDELPGAIGRRLSFVGARNRLLETHRRHHREARAFRALDEEERLVDIRERLADPEVHAAGVGLILQLPIEQTAHVVGALGILGIVRPGEGEISGNERVALCCHLTSDLHGVPVDVIDLALQADGRELVVAGVERHGLEHVDTGT